MSNLFNKNKTLDKFKSNNQKKIELISNELEILDPLNLLTDSDPSNPQATEIITQIQHYYYLIKEEAAILKNYEAEQKELEEKKYEKQKIIEEQKRPKCDLVYFFEKDFNKKNENFEKNKQKRKPTIDFKVKTQNLENEIVSLTQYINHTRARNELLKKDLDKLRENVIINTKKVEIVERECIKQQQEFNEMKANVDKIHKSIQDEKKNHNDKILERINKDKNNLSKKNNDIIEFVKKADKDFTKKYAKIKYYDHEEVKINEENSAIIAKWKKELRNFMEDKKDDIHKYKTYDPSSKIIEFVKSDPDKIRNLENIMVKMCEVTNLDDIYQLVNFIINCTKEYKHFENYVVALDNKVLELEKEVDELEFIINFCEKNIESKNNNLDENQIKEIEKMKEMAVIFLELQYDVIVEQYKIYCDKVKYVVLGFIESNNEEIDKNLEFMELLRICLDKIQNIIRNITISMKNNVVVNKNRDTNRIDINSAFNDKIEKAKTAAKFLYDGYGININIDNIRSVINPIINVQNNK